MKTIDDVDNNYTSKLYKQIGMNVKKYREQKGISQLALSHAIGYKSVTTVSCCEICYKNYHFNIDHINKISYVLDIPICRFFEDSK